MINTIFTLAFAQSGWLLLAIWRQRDLNPAGQKHLMLLIGSLCLIMAEVWLLQSGLLLSLAGASAAVPLVIGPAFYCYARSLTAAACSSSSIPAHTNPGGHYLPAVLLTLWQWFALAGILPGPGILLVLAKALSLFGYIMATVLLLWPATDLLRRRLRQSAVVMLTLICLAFVLFIAESSGLQFWPGSDLLAGLSLAIFVYAVSFIVLLDWQNYLLQLQPAPPHMQSVPTLAKEKSPTTENDSARPAKLDPDTARLVYEDLWQKVQQEQLWRQPLCRLADLSQATGLAEHYLSYVINLQAGCNSQIWINKFRVEAAKQLLAENDLPVLEIGLQVGFNSKATFNRAFKDLTGETPTAWRQRSRQPR